MAYTHAEITAFLCLDTQRSQGTVACHISGDGGHTDLEYRGARGKWTLATVDDENAADPEYLAFLWNDGAAIIRQFLAAQLSL